MMESLQNIDLHHFPLARPLSPEQTKVVMQKTRINLRQSQKSRDRLALAWNLLDMSAIQRIQSRYEGAIQALDEAKATFEVLEDKFGLAMVYQEYSIVYREMNRLSMFFDFANKAFALLQTLKQPQELAWSHLHLAMAFLDRNEYGESLNHSKRAHAIFSEYQNNMGVAWSLFLLAKNFKTQMALDTAEDNLNRAYNYFSSSAADSFGKADCLFEKAEIEIYKGNHKIALNLLNQAKIEFQELNKKDKLAWIELRQSEIIFLSNEKLALDGCKKSLISFRSLRDTNGSASAHFQKGVFLKKMGEPLKAWEELREAVRFHTDNSQLLGLLFDFKEIALVQFELNEVVYANESLEKALKIAQDLKLSYWINNLLAVKTLIQMISNQWSGGATLLAGNDKVYTEIQLRAALLTSDTRLAESILELEKSKVPQEDLTPQYYLEMGFCLWVLGEISQAVEKWKIAYEKSGIARYSTKKAEAALLLYLYSEESQYKDLAQVEKIIKESNSRRLKEKIILFKNQKGFDKNSKMIINSIISPL